MAGDERSKSDTSNDNAVVISNGILEMSLCKGMIFGLALLRYDWLPTQTHVANSESLVAVAKISFQVNPANTVPANTRHRSSSVLSKPDHKK